MLQFIMERNVLLYVLAAACAVGVISQMLLKGLYDRLIRDTKNTGEPSGRFLVQLRQRFWYCTHLNEKVGDVPALIQKSLMEYRFWGMSLHQWKRFGLAAFFLAFLSAAGGCAILVQNGASLIQDNRYFWLGALVLILTAAAAGISDTGYRETLLTVGLTDYLENSGAVKSGSAEMEEPEEAVYGNTVAATPIVSVTEGRRAKRRAARAESAAAETKAQREKRELKENLARARAGIQETAAAGEREKDSRAEVLRSMDPKEQERILKEVLREFLS